MTKYSTLNLQSDICIQPCIPQFNLFKTPIVNHGAPQVMEVFVFLPEHASYITNGRMAKAIKLVLHALYEFNPTISISFRIVKYVVAVLLISDFRFHFSFPNTL